MPGMAGTVPLLTDYLALHYNYGEAEAGWRRLYVSRYNAEKPLTVPWNREFSDPKGMHSEGGWSILQGPCSYALRAHVRCKMLEPGCGTHIQGVVVRREPDGTQTIVSYDEGTERFVGQYESSHTHIDGDLFGVLRAGEFLQVQVNYWNAGRNADGTLKPQSQVWGYVVGASVRGFWGPAPDEAAPPAQVGA